MAAHLFALHAGLDATTVEYAGDDPRLPEAVREFNARSGIESVVVAPLVLPTRNARLGRAVDRATRRRARAMWRVALVEAIARQATLALHQSRLAEQSRLEERRKAVLEERNRLARDIHDTLAQGFAAILMQLQAAQRRAARRCRRRSRAASRPPSISPARTWSRRAARSARCGRSVGDGEDVGAGARSA